MDLETPLSLLRKIDGEATNRLAPLDGLRALAAVAVLCSHTGTFACSIRRVRITARLHLLGVEPRKFQSCKPWPEALHSEGNIELATFCIEEASLS
jgi:hypothetical protein